MGVTMIRWKQTTSGCVQLAIGTCERGNRTCSSAKMHEMALHGLVKVGLDTVSRLLTRRTEPQVKLH